MNKIINKDCLEALKELPDNSVDSIVTDPPAGISFMNKSWDDDKGGRDNWIAWMQEIATECHRVLKPGGHGLVWSIPRTSHWTAMAWENAGFEIRDNISHVFGSGFPKSLNVRLNIDKNYDKLKEVWKKEFAYIAEKLLKEVLATSKGELFAIELAEPSSQHSNVSVKFVVKTLLKNEAKSQTPNIITVTENVKELLKESLGNKIKDEEAQKIYLGKWMSSKETDINANFVELIENLKHTILKKSGIIQSYDTNYQMECVFATNVIITEFIKECLITNMVDILKEINYSLHNGFGTALKPAREDWWLIRKPIEKGLSIAENCLKWGVGGINIDGSRVEGNEEIPTFTRDLSNAHGNKFGAGVSIPTKSNGVTGVGRFPANLIHDGSEEVLELFPESNSPRVNNPKNGVTSGNSMNFGNSSKKPAGEMFDYRDTGSAARFFYCAKASKSERNMGLDGFPDVLEHGHYAQDEWSRNNMGNTPDSKREPTKNNHPTVKPIKLMEYLVNLVSKEGHTVLDPFCGSGTTGIACKKLNRNFIGVERDEEYCKIATARIESVSQNNTLFV